MLTMNTVGEPPEVAKPPRMWLRRTVALLAASLPVAFGDPYLDVLGDGKHNDKSAEIAEADRYYQKHFGDFTARDQFQMQYVTGQEVTVPAKLVSGNGFLGVIGFVSSEREKRISYNLGGTCLAGTPYDTTRGAVISQTFDYDTNPDQKPDGNLAYTIYPANNSNAPELHFLYSRYGIPGGLLPLDDSFAPSHNKEILFAYGCHDVTVTPPNPKG